MKKSRAAKKTAFAGLLLALLLSVSGCAGNTAQSAGAEETAESGAQSADEAGDAGDGEDGLTDGNGTSGAVASGDETIAAAKVGTDGMEAVTAADIKDGEYSIEVDSSSDMFRITECTLTVADGQMTALMTMSGTGYLKLYMGTGEEAAKAPEDECIPYVETADGTHTFTVPVEALDQETACSAYSKRKEKWYDRTLVFRADSLPEEAFLTSSLKTAADLGLADGTYLVNVTLEGGSGRASVESPTGITVKDGAVTATVTFSSPNYDYMVVDGERYEPVNTEGNSAFEIPVAGFDKKLSVSADTTAMSTPHEIEYTLLFDSESLQLQTADAKKASSYELAYASQFTIEDYRGGRLITVKNGGGKFLVMPQGAKEPSGLSGDITVLHQPVSHIYLAATSAMDLIAGLDGTDAVTLSGAEEDGWYVEEAQKAMQSGRMKYAGKYSAPDYEQILADGCELAIESTMIYHSPEVKEQLESLGIPVFVERSSYETNPLGRLEWIRVYGVLLGKEELADQIFAEQVRKVKAAESEPVTAQKTAAFFYVNSRGAVNVRKPGDYVPAMIAMAGGSYVPASLSGDDNALSTMNMQMEAFYAAAKDADFLIYNSTIDGGISTVAELLEKNGLFADFKAVKEGHVWCTGKNMFQETLGVADMITDLHRLFTEGSPEAGDFVYLYPLK